MICSKCLKKSEVGGSRGKFHGAWPPASKWLRMVHVKKIEAQGGRRAGYVIT
jgi:hypothetical protein